MGTLQRAKSNDQSECRTRAKWTAYFNKKTHRHVVVSTIAPPITGAPPDEIPKAIGIMIETKVLALPGISVATLRVKVNKPAPPIP